MAWTLTVTGLTGVRQQYATAVQQTSQTLAHVMRARLADAAQYAKETYRSASATTSTATAVRTGALRSAIGSRVQQQGHTTLGTLGYLQGNAPYASVHEGWPDNRAGTTIRPRTAQFLAIPLEAARTATGVARGRPRDFPNTFVRSSKAGAGLIIFQRQGKNVVPLFLLVQEVYVPARPALVPTLNRYLPIIVEDLTKAVTEPFKS
jgi:hypothetical protein